MEKQFTDAKGRVWKLTLTYGDIRRVRNLVGVNLLGIDDKRTLTEEEALKLSVDELPIMMRLNIDELLLIDVLYGMVEPQAKPLEVDDVEFGMSLTPEIVQIAKDGFWEVWQDFFQRGGKEQQAKLMKAYRAACKTTSEEEEALDKALEDAQQEAEQRTLEMLKKRSGN